MSKKIAVGLLVAVVAVALLVSSAAFAQETDATLESLYEQIHELRRQVVQRRVELGDFTAEEGENRLELMEERFQQRAEEGFRPFKGGFGRGWERGGEARGFGHCWRD